MAHNIKPGVATGDQVQEIFKYAKEILDDVRKCKTKNIYYTAKTKKIILIEMEK